jgi:hypothetical protein
MGALNEIEFSEFVMKAQAFADAINAAPEFPDMLQEVARARELDQFASDHDAQLAFQLRARQAAWSPGYLQQNAARLGFVPGALPGRMVLPAGAAGLSPVLGLGYDTQAALSDDPEQSAIRELSLSLDVAHVPRAEQPAPGGRCPVREHGRRAVRPERQPAARHGHGPHCRRPGAALRPARRPRPVRWLAAGPSFVQLKGCFAHD